MPKDTYAGKPPVDDSRVGDSVHTASGRRFWPLDPRPEEVYVIDIASALSKLCRFNGHCRKFYSVCDHSIRVTEIVERRGGSADEQLWALLHDAGEAYVGDMTRPMKNSSEMGEVYKTVENNILRVVMGKFGLGPDMPKIVRLADDVMLATEARDLMRDASDWHFEELPLEERISPRSPREAKGEFVLMFNDLTEKRRATRKEK